MSAGAAGAIDDRPAERLQLHCARLRELPSHLMCSVIGTCLGLGTLRNLVPRYADVDRGHATDLEHTLPRLTRLWVQPRAWRSFTKECTE